MIGVANISKHYGSPTAVGDVSFSYEPPTIIDLLGPNGTGKSTTLGMITGLAWPGSTPGHAAVAVAVAGLSRHARRLTGAGSCYP